jgi:hypothetical protein
MNREVPEKFHRGTFARGSGSYADNRLRQRQFDLSASVAGGERYMSIGTILLIILIIVLLGGFSGFGGGRFYGTGYYGGGGLGLVIVILLILVLLGRI